MSPLHINECSVIVGDLPKVLDLRNHELTATLEESLHIIDNDNVEVIYLPDIAPSLYSVVIENLPNLKEVHVSGDVLWLRCVNLPNLNILDIGGSLKWLLLDGLKTIKTLDVYMHAILNQKGYFSALNIDSIYKNIPIFINMLSNYTWVNIQCIWWVKFRCNIT